MSDTGRHQAERMEALGRLAGGVAHDFNNLLTAIVGNAALLQLRSDVDPEVARVAGEIRRAGERAADLVRQLLAFSRRQAGAPRVIAADTVLRESEKLLRRLIGEHIRLMVQPGARPDHILLDPARFDQVVMNLAVNARDAMPQGGEVVIATTTVAGNYRLSVIDTGVGMDDVTRHRAFEPFFTTKPPGQGTGLGLAVVWGIVAEAGGRVAIDSAPGAGTRVTVELPLTEAPLTQISGEHRLPQPGGGERILIVEDDEQVRNLMAAALGDAGFAILTASDGRAALDLPHQPIDLLITDVVMPRLGGIDLAGELRRQRPGLKVLFVSGYSESTVAAAPGQALLAKPFTPIRLLREVRQLLDG
jgi:CheY-like chemotaxis protein